MAETSAYVEIKKFSSDQEFRTKIQQAIDLTRYAYSEERMRKTNLTALGKLHGDGIKITLMSKDGLSTENEEIWFMLDREYKGWMISAGCSSGNDGVWHAYRKVLESLDKK